MAAAINSTTESSNAVIRPLKPSANVKINDITKVKVRNDSQLII